MDALVKKKNANLLSGSNSLILSDPNDVHASRVVSYVLAIYNGYQQTSLRQNRLVVQSEPIMAINVGGSIQFGRNRNCGVTFNRTLHRFLTTGHCA